MKNEFISHLFLSLLLEAISPNFTRLPISPGATRAGVSLLWFNYTVDSRRDPLQKMSHMATLAFIVPSLNTSPPAQGGDKASGHANYEVSGCLLAYSYTLISPSPFFSATCFFRGDSWKTQAAPGNCFEVISYCWAVPYVKLRKGSFFPQPRHRLRSSSRQIAEGSRVAEGFTHRRESGGLRGSPC